jgi:hypothetical protein
MSPDHSQGVINGLNTYGYSIGDSLETWNQMGFLDRMCRGNAFQRYLAILRLASLRETGKGSDLVIVCGTESFNVHKCVMCTASEWFDKACNNENWKASSDVRPLDIVLVPDQTRLGSK